jgi:Protein of unknown function (DUF1266)
MWLFDFFKTVAIPGNSVVPDDESGISAMLLGAMYNEESGLLAKIEKEYKKSYDNDELESMLDEAFTYLDMWLLESIDAEEVQWLLHDGWNIDNKNELMMTLDWLMNGMSEKSLEEFKKFDGSFTDNPEAVESFIQKSEYLYSWKKIQKQMTEEEEDTNAFMDMLQGIKNGANESSISLLGWDYARYIHLVRLGFLAGFIEIPEAWQLAKNINPKAQKAFKNFEDFSASYLAWRILWQWWAGAMDDVCERLLASEVSPWSFYGWYE